MARRSTSPALQGIQSAMTPGMLGTGGFDPAADPLGLALHGRAQQHEDDYYSAEHARDDAPGMNPQLKVAHQMNEGQNRISNMNAGGWGDWLQAFNEATGGKGRFAPGTNFMDAPKSTFDPSFQTSAVTPSPALAGLSRSVKGKKGLI